MTVAVDTNVLIRWITRDDAVQAARADVVFATPISISLTVLIETAWVLKGPGYRLERAIIADLLDRLAATRTIALEHEDGVRWAIARYRAGADFADMIHLVSVIDAGAFVTFDQRLAGDAGPNPPVAVETLA